MRHEPRTDKAKFPAPASDVKAAIQQRPLYFILGYTQLPGHLTRCLQPLCRNLRYLARQRLQLIGQGRVGIGANLRA